MLCVGGLKVGFWQKNGDFVYFYMLNMASLLEFVYLRGLPL